MPGPSRSGSSSSATRRRRRRRAVLCSCLVAYRKAPEVLAWVSDAARAILQGAGRLAREGDQEHLWLQRVTNATHARLRVLGLPDEYYCPYAERVRVEAPAGEPPALRADVTIGRVSYACRSVHGHGVNHAMVESVVKDPVVR